MLYIIFFGFRDIQTVFALIMRENGCFPGAAKYDLRRVPNLENHTKIKTFILTNTTCPRKSDTVFQFRDIPSKKKYNTPACLAKIHIQPNSTYYSGPIKACIIIHEC